MTQSPRLRAAVLFGGAALLMGLLHRALWPIGVFGTGAAMVCGAVLAPWLTAKAWQRSAIWGLGYGALVTLAAFVVAVLALAVVQTVLEAPAGLGEALQTYGGFVLLGLIFGGIGYLPLGLMLGSGAGWLFFRAVQALAEPSG